MRTRSTDKQKLLENELKELVPNKNEMIMHLPKEKAEQFRDNREMAIINQINAIQFNCFKCVKNTCTNADREEKGRMISTTTSDNKMDESVQDMMDADFFINKADWRYEETKVWICNECLEKENQYWSNLHKKAHEKEKNQNKSIVGNTVCLNPDEKEKERIYRMIEPTRNSYRNFDGKYHRHCSKCPFAEGCITCALP